MANELMDPLLSAWRKTPEGRRVHGDAFMSEYVMPLVYEPGESWMYSVSIDWAGKLVEHANGGVALETYMQQDITFHLEKKALVKQRRIEMTSRVPESGLLIPQSWSPYFAPERVNHASGGSGLWGSAPEFLKVLTSILRDDGKLLASGIVMEMFKSQLSPASKNSCIVILKFTHGNAAFEFTWGLGGKRKKGSLAWGGYPNLFWWIDPEAGVAGLYASHLLPTDDKESTDLLDEFEKDLYKQAQAL
ncbi:beta-lactamase/transpeptidase-like protein [Athelia psychrophila]|uniref:Beta-lactamase/transpeptidase-like protein n=1 Tax=Athelia psychrophila TaxID=1759441 RepID=A0A166L963_9AGAM|nr:beta-lactamase/transpeptidase-like protein [Fibularhizoctonia sp. CBS 109695]